MPDYSKGKIYTIRCKTDDTLIYVGSTIQPLSKRLGGHKNDCLKYPNMLLYQTIKDWNDWYIELYENYPCISKEELTQKEGQVIREISTLNTRIEGRKFNEWYKENIEEQKQKQKLYREKNKEKYSEYMKSYQETNKEKLKQYKKEWYLKTIS